MPEIQWLGQMDTQPLMPRITARGRQTKGMHQPVPKKTPYHKLYSAILYCAIQDYHRTKRMQKRRNISTRADYLRMPKGRREVFMLGVRAFEWFRNAPTEGYGVTFKEVCDLLGADPEKLWKKIKASRDRVPENYPLEETEECI